MFSGLSRVQEDRERLRRGVLQGAQYVTLGVLPVMVGMALVAAPALELVFGRKWLPAAPVVSVLALAGFLQLMTTLGPSGLNAAGRTDLNLRWTMISSLLYLPAFAVGLRWGIVGVATGYLGATIVMVPVQFRYISSILHVRAAAMWAAGRPGGSGPACRGGRTPPPPGARRSTSSRSPPPPRSPASRRPPPPRRPASRRAP